MVSAGRRRFLGAVGGVAIGLATGGCSPTSAPATSGSAGGSGGAGVPVGELPAAAQPGGSVSAAGIHQAGIVDPSLPQPNLLLTVFESPLTERSAVGTLIAELGTAVLALTAGQDPRLAGLAAGDLTVTVGIGPRWVRLAGDDLPGGQPLPSFRREQLSERSTGGELMLQVCASDPLLLSPAMSALSNVVGGRATELWRQRAVRGPSLTLAPGRAAPRNLLGFVDGIVGPVGDKDYDADLWLSAPPEVAAGTIAVVRRMEIDLTSFLSMPLAQQEAAIGRRRDTAVPLSGGAPSDGIDLGAKTADGHYLVPAAAHARRAHALAAGVPLMLRRSYSIDDPAAGLLFISFQNALRTFTATLARMDESDDLLVHTTTTASGTFLILPGFDQRRPLGATLFGTG